MIPKKVKLGGCMIEVKELTRDQMDGEVEGKFKHEDQQIQISSHMNDDRKEQIFTHEMLHAMTDFTGLAATMDTELEEDIVNRLAPVLHTFLKDNGLWFKSSK